MSLVHDTLARIEAQDDPERAAMLLLEEIRSRFGWAGVEVTRQDVEAAIGRELDASDWQGLLASQSWRSGSAALRDSDAVAALLQRAVETFMGDPTPMP